MHSGAGAAPVTKRRQWIKSKEYFFEYPTLADKDFQVSCTVEDEEAAKHLLRSVNNKKSSLGIKLRAYVSQNTVIIQKTGLLSEIPEGMTLKEFVNQKIMDFAPGEQVSNERYKLLTALRQKQDEELKKLNEYKDTMENNTRPVQQILANFTSQMIGEETELNLLTDDCTKLKNKKIKCETREARRLQKCEQELAEQNDKLREQNSKIEKLEETIKACQIDIANLEKRMEDDLKESKENEENNKNLPEQLSHLKESRTILRYNKLELKKEIKKINGERKDKEQVYQVKFDSAELALQAGKLEASQKLLEEAREIQTSLSKLDEDMNAAQQQLNILAIKLSDNKAKKLKLGSENNELNKKNKQLLLEKAINEQKLIREKQNLKELTGSVQSLNLEVKNTKDIIATKNLLKKEIEEGNKRKLAKHANEIAAKELEIQKQNNSLNLLRDNINNFKNTLSGFAISLAEVQQKNQSLLAEIQATEDEIQKILYAVVDEPEPQPTQANPDGDSYFVNQYAGYDQYSHNFQAEQLSTVVTPTFVLSDPSSESPVSTSLMHEFFYSPAMSAPAMSAPENTPIRTPIQSPSTSCQPWQPQPTMHTQQTEKEKERNRMLSYMHAIQAVQQTKKNQLQAQSKAQSQNKRHKSGQR